MKLASIIVNNYNYGRFLGEAVESALGQTYRHTEVVVVDDGSTDDSREVLEQYRDHATILFKENGGQASAFNAGFEASRGEVVLFLDSDDMHLPTAVERAMPFFEADDIVKVHWPLWLADERGRATGRMYPGPTLPEGDLTRSVCALGPTNNLSAPGCGNAWSRRFLEQLFPIPEQLYLNGCDTLLFEAAPFYGRIGFVREPQTLYRQHAKSDHVATEPSEKIARELRFYEHYAPILLSRCQRLGLQPSLEEWRRNSWWHRHADALDDIAALPAGGLILVDDGSWEVGSIAARKPLRLIERDGIDWGPPSSDEEAIAELERRRASGARFIVFGWPAFWWLDHYAGFRKYLDNEFRCVLRNARVIAYDMRYDR